MVRSPCFAAVDWNGTVVPFFHEPPYPGAIDVLGRWRESGILVAVVSHANQFTIEADVERTGLQADAVFGVHEKAPAFLELRLRLGSGVVLGDHPSDLRAALEADLPFFQARLDGQPAFDGIAGSFSDWQEMDCLLRAVGA